MLSLNSLEVRKSLQERLLEQAVQAHKLSVEHFEEIVEVFNRNHIAIVNFWNYVTNRDIEGEIANSAISSAIKEVLTVEQFNNLIKHDITWAN